MGNRTVMQVDNTCGILRHTASLWSRCVLRHGLHVEKVLLFVHGVAKSDMDIMDDISCCKFGFLRKDA